MAADPKATPISALPRGPSGQGEDDQQFIQNILSQMKDDSQESEQAYQQTQQNYTNQQFGHNPGEQHQRNQQQLAQAQYDQMDDSQYEQQYQYQEEPKLSFADKLKQAIKAPLLFLVLYVVLCVPFVRNAVVTQVARFTENAGYQAYGATFILGLVGAVIFYLINKFVF